MSIDANDDRTASSTENNVSSRAIDLATLPIGMESGLNVLRIPLARSLVSIEITITCDPSTVRRNASNSGNVIYPAFMLNLGVGNDIAYHMGVRPLQGQVVQNTCMAGRWGLEENRPIPAEFLSDQPFTLKVALEQTVVVSLNGQVFSRFAHRLPATQIDAVHLVYPPGNLQVQSVQVVERADGEIDTPADVPSESPTENHQPINWAIASQPPLPPSVPVPATSPETIDPPPFLRDLPAQFEPLRSLLAANLVPYIKIQAGAEVGSLDWLNGGTGDPLTVWQSKIGGNPYFPKDRQYPTESDTGKAMPLLLQINCADVPPIAGFDFPQRGMLQVYLGFEPADASGTPGKYQVLYFPELSTDVQDLITDFSFLEIDNTIQELYPEVYPITFAVSHDLFGESRPVEAMDLPEELQELGAAFDEWLGDYLYETETRIRGSKLGGYVDFHSDTDEIAESANGRLLLELVHPFYSDDSFLFFIPDDQLGDRDFSQVEFYFVCD